MSTRDCPRGPLLVLHYETLSPTSGQFALTPEDLPARAVMPDTALTRTQTDRLSRNDKGEKKKGNGQGVPGTASPHGSGSTQSPSNSAQGTPTSSQTHLVDQRNKPLPPENGSGPEARSNNGGAVTAAQIAQSNQQGGPAGSSFHQGQYQHPGSNAPSTPDRMQPLAPSVVVSPSAPVCIVLL